MVLPNWELLKKNKDLLDIGRGHFVIRCAYCHGYDGKGSKLAPNLTDNEWIYQDSYNSIFLIINNGSPNRKMLGWNKKLKQEDLYAITLYVKSLSEPKHIKK
jgi:cytochrome c oxidase cbb3-type subunit 3